MNEIMSHLIRDIKEIKRFDEILGVFFEEGFDYLIKDLKFHSRVKETNKANRAKRSIRRSKATRLRQAFERLGPTFIKLGQILSVRPDLVPPEYIKEFEKLQEHTTEIEFSKIKSVIEKELGKKIKDTFVDINEKPIASASIAQVHLATLKPNKKVVIKVQKPLIRELMTKDIHIFFFIAKILEKHNKSLKNIRPVDIVREFADWTFRELDFCQEAKYMRRFRKNMTGENVRIPKVYDEFTTDKLLVMEYVKGSHIKDYKFNTITKKKRFAENLANALGKMIFEDGFFHGDPHPGNIYVLKKEVPLLFDFGIVGILESDLRKEICEFFIDIIEHNTKSVLDRAVKICEQTDNSNEEQFREQGKKIIENWYGKSVNEASFVRSLYDLIKIGSREGVVFPSEFVLVGKALLDFEGIGLQIYPEFNAEELFKPWFEKMIVSRYDPVKLAEKTLIDLKKNREYYEHLPNHLMKVIEKVESGGFNVKFDESSVKRMGMANYYSDLVKALAIIAAVLIVSSTYLLVNEKEIMVRGIHIGYIELGLALIILLYILKHRVN